MGQPNYTAPVPSLLEDTEDLLEEMNIDTENVSSEATPTATISDASGN